MRSQPSEEKSQSPSSGSLTIRQRYSLAVDSPTEAMRIDAVYRCVDILSGTIASLPLESLRRIGNVYKPNDGDNLNYLFSRQANPRQSFYVLMQNAIISLLLRGNAYILPERRGLEVVGLYLLNSDAVSYDVYTNTYQVHDYITKKVHKYEASEIIHLRNKSLDGGYVGVSTLQYAGRTMAISANADEQTLDGFKRGNRLKGFISGGDITRGMGVLQDEVVDKMAERLESEINEDRSVMRLSGSVTFTPLSISPADAQLLENRRFSPYSICRFFGVHPDMVFVDGGSSNYKASENSQIVFLNQTLRPLLSQIESEFACKLIAGSMGTQLKRKIRFDLTPLYTSDLKSKGEYYKTSIEAGVLTPNEVRALEGRDPVEGGDISFISCNVAPIDSPKIRGGE